MILLQMLMMITPEGEGALRRWIPAAFPPYDLLWRQPSVSLFLVLCFFAAFFWKTSGDYFYRRFQVTRMLQGEGSTQTGPRGSKLVGPRGYSTRPRGAPSSAPPASVRLLLSLLGLPPSKIMIPVNLQLIWTLFGSLKHQNIENRVFCQCRVNSK